MRALILRVTLMFGLIAAFPALGAATQAQDQTGSITLTFYACPKGMTRDTLAADQCSLITSGFDAQITFDAGQQSLTLADATSDGTSFIWANLPVAPSHDSGEGDPYFYHVEETSLPTGYADYLVSGMPGYAARGDELETYFTTRLVVDDSTLSFNVYNFVEAPPTVEPATVTITASICPAGYTGEDYAAHCAPYPVSGAWFRAGRVGDSVALAHVFAMGKADDSGAITLTAVRSALRGAINVSEDLIAYRRNDAYIKMDTIDGVAVTCTMADGAPVDVQQIAFTKGSSVIVQIPIQPGAAIACNWYNLNANRGSYTGQPYEGSLYALACDADPGPISIYPGPFPPAGCTALSDVGLSVESEAGDAIGSCVTDATGTCTVGIPTNERMVITEDEDMLPEGYAPLTNPITARFSSELGPPIFVNLPSGGEQPTPTETRKPTVEPTGTSEPVTPQPTATHGAVIEPTETPLPADARPIHIHPGVCGKLRDNDSYALTDLTIATGTPEGAKQATAAESSFTALDVSLDDLLASPHAINVHASRSDMRAYLVCGEIGGVRGADGSLAVGLREVNASGYEGIAYLLPDPNDPTKTDVWVFIAPKLADEEQATPTTSPVS